MPTMRVKNGEGASMPLPTSTCSHPPIHPHPSPAPQSQSPSPTPLPQLAPTHPSTHIPHPHHNRNHNRQFNTHHHHRHRRVSMGTLSPPPSRPTPISPLPIHASPCWASLQSTIWSLPIQHVFEVIPIVGLWVSCGLCLSKLANPASLSFFLSHYTRKCSTNCLRMACCQMLNARMANLVV